MKLDDHGKVETTLSRADSQSAFTERTAMIGVKQTLHRAGGGLTYSQLFQLKPSLTPMTTTTSTFKPRYCSRHETKYTSTCPSRLSSVSMIQPLVDGCTSSAAALYDSPYCAWCFEASSSSTQRQCQPSVTSCDHDITSESNQYMYQRPQRLLQLNANEDSSGTNEDVLAMCSSDALTSRRLPTKQLDIAWDKEAGFAVSPATSPDIIVSTATMQYEPI